MQSVHTEDSAITKSAGAPSWRVVMCAHWNTPSSVPATNAGPIARRRNGEAARQRRNIE